MKKRHLFVAASAFMLLAACNSSNDGNGQENTSEDGNSDTGSITVTDIQGEQTFTEPAKRVVALDWTYVENLLALGVQPVGVADVENYHKWVDIREELSDDVVDVGLRTEPNLEAIAQLEPDLIISANYRSENIEQELKDIAPMLIFDPYPEESKGITHYEEMETTFREMAKVLDKEAEGEAIMAELDEKYEEGKEKIESMDLETKDFVLTMAYTDNQAPVFRLFNPNGMAPAILEKIGLNNAYDSGSFELYGYATTGVEELLSVEDANFLHIVQDDDGLFEEGLANNAVWNDLNFVKEGRVYALGGDTWPYGGPLSAMTLIDRTVEALDQ
ncbi:ABC transporter substrate-binding protein [Shouchella clausii]|uniref:ABC transporter substrate-binding protein n=1 Tax=Shouchella clausii TaxID=79880 RepID=UPI000BA6779F|nr:iron-siderophore ABC transporter substrate-binding protein [Shouchella clausii]PAD92367.1 ferrichrome ABC transporter substrate-binding protein [Shouchella clausii]